MSKEYSITAEILTVQGGSCTFRAEGMDRDMRLPLDHDCVERIIDDLIQAAFTHSTRKLKIRGGIIRGVEKA